VSDIKKILSDNGYSDAMVAFFADAQYPISENTLRLAKQKKDFFDIYMSYAHDVLKYAINNSGLFLSENGIKNLIKEYETRYKQLFLSEHGKFIYPAKIENGKAHYWVTDGLTDVDF
jgi:hypothetical protein